MALAAPQTSATTRFTSIPAKLPVYWHLLSLDAPTVAALWCWSFSCVAHIDLPALAPALLAVGTWLIYIADRILDGLDRTNWQRLRERHFFYSQHRATFLLVGAIISPVFAWIVFTRMSPAVRLGDAAVFAIAAFYFLIVHTHGRQAERWLPKELAVGVLFAVATAVPTWARVANAKSALIPSVVIFAALCWLNCVAIESWEGSAMDSSHSTTSWAAHHLRGLASTTVGFSLALALASLHNRASVSLFLASAMSGLLIIWLASRKERFAPIQLRVAVDATLLTPLLFVVWMR